MILCGGFDKVKAENAIENGNTDLVAFGKPFLSNPNLVKKLETNAELLQPDFTTLYTPGIKGYTDYPFVEEATAVL